ncbi:MAG TPA: hypothetical protein VHA56_07215 [Mucilaginibacter sp.]|nr:hypothetical protein [Mucilaginibacter sp.]
MTNQPLINIDDIIEALPLLDHTDRMRLQSALFGFQNDMDLKEALRENLEALKNSRVNQE